MKALALLFAASAAAAPLATFDASIPGSVTGASIGASRSTCSAADLAPAPDQAGAARLALAPPVLGGEPVLALATGPAEPGALSLAQTRWEMPFQVAEDSQLVGHVAFVTADRADHGDWWAVLIDGRVEACGDAATMTPALDGVLAAGDRSAGWQPLPESVLAPGLHVITVVVGDGTDSTGDSTLLLGGIGIEPRGAGGPDCMPAPPSLVNEIPLEDVHVNDRWTFDDNRFCAAGPQLDCSRVNEQTGAIENPNPSGFVNSTNQSFEMYIVADCGTEMHLPLNDVESGCISIFDEDRFPVTIQVTNGAGFDETGGEVCWSAVNCDGGGANNPGGPGNDEIMDVRIDGSPTLCGVYIVNFRSWAGCIWDLFANCDGSGSSGFNIYDDFCLAQDAINPLPELVIDSLTLSSGDGCFVDFCAIVRNIGCATVTDATLQVTANANPSLREHLLVTLGPGATTQLCGRIDLPYTNPLITVGITAAFDPDNTVLECTESPDASACDPAFGSNVRFSSIQINCDDPPICDAGGPYFSACGSGTASIQLDGTGSSDPDGLPLQYLWSTSCPGATISNPTSATPTLVLSGTCGGCAVTLQITDSAGNVLTCSAPVTLGDAVPPVVSCPANLAVPCGTPPGPARAAWLVQATATDACQGPVPVVTTLLSTTPGCAGPVETWEFRATDSCNNTAACTRTFSIVDAVAPAVTPPPNATHECGTPGGDVNAWLAQASANDACAGPVPVTSVLVDTQVPCPGTSVRTYRFDAVDPCGNPASATATFTVQDTQPPTLAGVPPNANAECAAPPAAPVTASDLCDPSVPVTFSETSVPGTCPVLRVVTRTWTATDDCGRSVMAQQIVTVTDSTPPSLAGVPPNATVNCVAPPPAVVMATDACDPSVPVTFSETSVPGSCPVIRVITRTWSASDDCGHPVQASQTITVMDPAGPSLAGVPADVTVSCGQLPGVPQVTASDDCDAVVVVSMNESIDPGSCPQERVVTRTWTASDSCGRTATGVQRITVVDDGLPSLQGVPPNVTIPCTAPEPMPVVTASDACDPAPVVTLVRTVTPGGCPQERVITKLWTAQDACGNAASAMQVITVTDDVAPTLSPGPADVAVECGQVPPPATLTATDDCDPAAVVTFEEIEAPTTHAATSGPRRFPGLRPRSTPDAHCPAHVQITRRWTARDACGNEDVHVQVIDVDDTQPPVLTAPADLVVACPAPATGPLSEAAWLAGASATDACSAATVMTTEVSRTDDCGDTYTLTVRFSAQDACGNAAVPVERTYRVIDAVPPVLTTPASVVIECPAPGGGEAAWIAQATATDDCGAAPVQATEISRVEGCGDTYVLTMRFAAVDACGNAAAPVDRTYSVIDDSPPAIDAPASVVVECPAPAGGEAAWIALASASDGCGGATVQTAEIRRVDGCGDTSSVEIEFWATDACGNESGRVRRTYEVVDTTPPQIAPPPDVVLECPAPPGSEADWIAQASATDTCGPATVESVEIDRQPGCSGTVLVTREFWAVDACGLESPRLARTWRVQDTTPPALAAPPDLTVECPAPASGPGSESAWLASAAASDACGGARVEMRLVADLPGCGATRARTWELWAVDGCALESARVQRTYTVADTLPPVFAGTGPRQFTTSIWPPNHGYVVFGTADVVSATDACGAVSVRATGCHSSQPEEVHQGRTDDGGNGDGRTFEDCVVSVDGTQFAVRAERLGSCGANGARHYTVAFTATDECGNVAPGAGDVVVEHDRNQHQPVNRGRKLGPNDPPPFPYLHPTTYGPGCGP